MPDVLTDPTYLAVYRLIADESQTAFQLHHEHVSKALSSFTLRDFGNEVQWFKPPHDQENDAVCCIVDVGNPNEYGAQAKAIYSAVVGGISPISPSVMPQETIDGFVGGWPARTQQVAAVVMPKLKEAGFTIQRAFGVFAYNDKQWGRFVAVRGTDVVDVLLADF